MYNFTTCGTNTLRYKQSSFPIIVSVIIEYCTHICPAENAFSVPDQPGCFSGGLNNTVGQNISEVTNL